MQFEVYEPPPAIRAWVVSGMHVSFDSPDATLRACHFPALVEGGLTVVLEGRFLVPAPSGAFVPLPSAFVGCARAQPITLLRTPRLRCIGLRLHPAATHALLRASPAQLPQQIADAADVFGPAWSGWVDGIAAAGAARPQVQALFAFAARRLGDAVHAERTRRAELLQRAALRLARPEDAVGLSVRQFERVFAGAFGVRPKLFQRVARVEAVLRDAVRRGTADAAIALDHGYYDQSHLARDLRELAGAPLRTLLAASRHPDSGHWALAVGTAARRAA